MSNAQPDEPHEPAAPARRRARLFAAGAAALVLAGLLALYLTGTFDRQLAGAGLNVTECARGAGGQTLCGSELEAARARQRQLAREEREISAKRELERQRYREERERELKDLERAAPARTGEPQAEAERAQRAARRRLEEELQAEG